MKNFIEITKNINSDLEKFEELLSLIFKDEDEALKEVFEFVFKTKGKRVRPILVYLFARLFGEVNNTTHNAAMLVELMHTATLLHDDVVDEAHLRRGKDTVNYKWDNKTAILAGDYLFAKAMKIATDYKEYKLFDIITPAVLDLSLGELQQLKNSQKFEIDELKYFSVIKNKTASLLSSCCVAGAYSTNSDENILKISEKFGEILGIIFQIKDDILDYVGDVNTGKDNGIDIKERKITLPLIRAYANMCNKDKEVLQNLWLIDTENPNKQSIIINLVVENNGIKEAEKVMVSYKNQALSLLLNFPKNPYRKALEKLVDFVIERQK